MKWGADWGLAFTKTEDGKESSEGEDWSWDLEGKFEEVSRERRAEAVESEEESERDWMW